MEEFYNKPCRYYTNCGKIFILEPTCKNTFIMNGVICCCNIIGIDTKKMEIIKL